MLATRKIIETIKQYIPKANENQSVSFPVLRTEKSVTYLAFFSCPSMENSWINTSKRPLGYMLADIANGKILSVQYCAQNEFSEQPYEKEYRLKPENGFVPNEEYLDKMFELMDSARQMIIEGSSEKHYERLYAQYLDMAKATMHPDYQVFYDDLSRLHEESAEIIKEAKEPAEQGENKAPVQEERLQEKTPEDVPSKKEILWKPSVNLSAVPERTFRILERISGRITFLDSDNPDELRLEYPLFCFPEDRKESGDEWQELQVRLLNSDLKMGHMRARPKDTIFTGCANKKKRGCMFGSCPYVAAAYIRFLKDNDPDELKRQRQAFREKRQSGGEQQAALPIRRPEGISDEQLAIGKKLHEDGLISVMEAGDGFIEVQWQEDLGPKGVQLQTRRIAKAAVEAGAEIDETSWGVKGEDGVNIPKQAAWAIASLCKAEENLKEADRGASPAEKQEEKPGIDAAEPNPPSQAEDMQQAKEQKTLPSEKGPEPKKEPGQAVREEGQKRKIPLFIDRGGLAHQCLNNPNITAFCGHVICEGYHPAPEAVKAMKALLKEKGFGQIVELRAEEFSSVKVEEKTAYLVTGIKKGLDITAFRRFYPGAVIILFGTKAMLDALFADQVVKTLYARCSMREARFDAEAIFRSIQESLPEALKERLTAQSKQNLMQWMKGRALPDNEEGVSAWIAWQCILENRIIFEQGTAERGKGYVKK